MENNNNNIQENQVITSRYFRGDLSTIYPSLKTRSCVIDSVDTHAMALTTKYVTSTPLRNPFLSITHIVFKYTILDCVVSKQSLWIIHTQMKYKYVYS